jgi:hypothetical protein
MKSYFKGNKHKYKIVLAGLLLALEFATALLRPAPPAKLSIYHLEASYETAKGGKVSFDKH